MSADYQIVIDQSTSGTKLILMKAGCIFKRYDKKHQQFYPKLGWVEHDPIEIWGNVVALFELALSDNELVYSDIAVISITNQRETVLAWDKETSLPVYPALVWQCNRTAAMCNMMIHEGKEPLVIEKTGLRLDPYFSGTKIKWLYDEVPDVSQLSKTGHLAIGTMDSWLIWKLTGHQVFATEKSNACRTLLFNIATQTWDSELASLFHASLSDLPEIKSSSDIFGYYHGIKIQGIMADSQAALHGQGCIEIGDVKVTLGTGASILMQLKAKGDTRDKRVLTTIGMSNATRTDYALEGIIRSCADSINWFTERISDFDDFDKACKIALTETHDHDVFFIPALQGLAAPFWENDAAATFTGMKRGNDKFDLLRAVLDSIIFQVKLVLATMEEVSGLTIEIVRVDGGVSKNKELMRALATLLDKKIIVNEVEELSAMGVAMLANATISLKNVKQKTIFPSQKKSIILKYEKWKRFLKKEVDDNITNNK